MDLILDNRKVVPDIIVNKHAVPNRFNINNNFSIENQPVKPEDTHSRPTYQNQLNPYATGNNNGSPLHVPWNGNYYSDIKGKNGSVKPFYSPQHKPYGASNKSMNCYGSPMKSLRFCSPYGNNNTTSNKSQEMRSFYLQDDKMDSYSLSSMNSKSNQGKFHNFSQQNSPAKGMRYNKVTSNLYSPKHGTEYSESTIPKPSRHNCDKDNVRNNSPSVFRSRSSSSPCIKNKYSNHPSKIPVHTSNKKNATSKIPLLNINSPHKALKDSQNSEKLKLSRKVSAPEFHNRHIHCTTNGDSPRKVNSNLRNCHVASKQINSPYRCPERPRNIQKNTQSNWNSNGKDHADWQWNLDNENSSETPRTFQNKTKTDWNSYEKDPGDWQWNLDNDSLYLTVGTDTTWNSDTSEQSGLATDSKGYYGDSWNSSDSDPLSFASSGCNKSGNEELEVFSDSGVENDNSFNSKMVIIKCKEANYLTKLFMNNEGIHGLRVVGRVGGAGRTSQHHVMSVDQPNSVFPDLNSNHNACSDDVRIKGELGLETAMSLSSHMDSEFVHETADYQWLLDYDMLNSRYRECYAKDCLGACRDGTSRVSVLNQGVDESHVSYEQLSRNIDASLAHIDMDDFRSEDIHQILAMPSICDDIQDDENEIYRNMTDSLNKDLQESIREDLRNRENTQHDNVMKNSTRTDQVVSNRSRHEDHEEDLSGVSGEGSLYQSGPLFSPLREPSNMPPSFSVDSLDSDSIHDDLILTCQANKNNYTIAFEGSFIQYSEDSDFPEQAESDTTGSWTNDRLRGRSPAPHMTHSDQPYTTWSRVSRRSSSQTRNPDDLHTHRSSPATRSPARFLQKHPVNKHIIESLQNDRETKSNSLPNLMKKSLMRRSLEASGQCVKVYDLQQSFRHMGNTRSVDSNNFSLMRLFMKQKNNSKEAFSTSSSLTDPSQEGVCSSSENQSYGNESTDWPMNSQSDLDGSASPVPMTATNNHIIHGRTFNRRDNLPNVLGLNQINTSDTTETTNTETDLITEGILNNNNVINSGGGDNTTNKTALEESLKETTCSKPPLTSPIREEPEGMDISMDNRYKTENSDNIAFNKKELENKINENRSSIIKSVEKSKNLPETPKHISKSEQQTNVSQRKRHDSGNSTSGYLSHKGSNEKLKRQMDSEKGVDEKPKPKPRLLKQLIDRSLQTSSIKASTMVNTSGLLNSKDVYVYYPNYALPDLGFLKDKKYNVDTRVFLVPQHYVHRRSTQKPKKDDSKRPYSCGDMERLRRLGFSHVKDWDSLNFLLPKELKEILFNDSNCVETQKPSFCDPSKPKIRPVSCDYSQKYSHDTKDSKNSSCSNSTQPSSGYRGSSTILNDSEAEISDAQFEKYSKDSSELSSIPHDGTGSQRPMLPRGILRKCTSLRDGTQKSTPKKRHSANYSRDVNRGNDTKRHSLQEPLKSNDKGSDNVMTCSCETDCTGFCAKGLRVKNLLLIDELPDVSSHEELSEAEMVRLRSQVSEFLFSEGRKSSESGDSGAISSDPQKKSVSFEEKRSSRSKKGAKESSKSFGSKETYQRRSLNMDDDFPAMLFDAQDKKTLVLSARNAVEKLVKHFNKGRSQQDKNKLGTSSLTPEVAQLVLDKLCPAIYALLSDGLLPSLHSLFGKISNSVWRVVEATSQIGPSTKALNDLVLTLNSEEGLSEGPVKFNAFIFGLLNIRSLDAWLGYLRTRESALQKHYHPEGFLYLANTAMRNLYDDLLHATRPLALLPFRLDILHEYKALHASMLKMEERLALHSSHSSTEKSLEKSGAKDLRVTTRAKDRSRSPRPRSCHENALGCETGQNTLKKRWSGVQLGSKLVTALDKLMAEEATGNISEDYSDSLETPRNKSSNTGDRYSYLSDDCATDMLISDLSSKDGDISERSATYKDTETEKNTQLKGKKQISESEGEKFRRLQLKWEALTGYNICDTTDNTYSDKAGIDSVTTPPGVPRSKIPRPVNLVSPNQPLKAFEVYKEKTSPQVKQGKRLPSKDFQPQIASRKSLKDRVLPSDHFSDVKPSMKPRSGHRAPASTVPSTLNVNRASSVPGRKAERGGSGRLVQTLHHRLATDNGHLSFNRGDVLSVVVEVDEKFILCCLQDRKGLVPRSSVVPFHN